MLGRAVRVVAAQFPQGGSHEGVELRWVRQASHVLEDVLCGLHKKVDAPVAVQVCLGRRVCSVLWRWSLPEPASLRVLSREAHWAICACRCT